MVVGTAPPRHAVVIGAGIGGLAAAQVLTEFYGHVTVMERDTMPTAVTSRPGVPQDQHVHGLLARGRQALEQVFPGLTGDLKALGFPTGDILGDARWYLDGHRLSPAPCGLLGVGITRPELEHQIRLRLRPNVTIVGGSTVTKLVPSPDRGTVCGVRAVTASGDEQALTADLIVDASGRNSRTPQWLSELGYPAPAEQRIRVDVAYTTCLFTLPGTPLSGDVGMVVSATPTNQRAGGMVLLADDRWLVSLCGYAPKHPPLSHEGLLEFASQLATADLYRAIRSGTPLTRPVRYRFTDVRRRHYQRLGRFPGGLIVLGDAACSFNPIYGQGMSVAASQALALREHLAQQRPSMAFRRNVARSGQVAWSMAVAADLRLPGITARRSVLSRLSGYYTTAAYRAASHDPRVGRTIIRVANLIDRPRRLVHPATLLRVLLGNRRSDAGPRATVREQDGT